MIEIEDLHKTFDGNEVLRGIKLSISKGEIIAIIGGSGEGKSVLLKHMAGLIKPDSGRIFIDKQDIIRPKNKVLRNMRERLGFLFQGGALFDSMTVYENVAFPLRERTKLNNDRIRERVYKELDHVGLVGSEHKYPSQISGGMIKRAGLARALIMDPEIMFFDEPTTGLDPIIAHSILELITACHKRISFTGVVVTHDIPDIFDYVDRVAMIHDGVIWAQGDPNELARSEDPVISKFMRVRSGWAQKQGLQTWS